MLSRIVAIGAVEAAPVLINRGRRGIVAIIAGQALIDLVLGDDDRLDLAVALDGGAQAMGDGDATLRIDRLKRKASEDSPLIHARSLIPDAKPLPPRKTQSRIRVRPEFTRQEVARPSVSSVYQAVDGETMPLSGKTGDRLGSEGFTEGNGLISTVPVLLLF